MWRIRPLGFSVITEFFYGEGWLAPRPTSNLEGQGLSFVRSLPFDQSSMVEPTRGQSPSRHSSWDHWDTQASPPQQGDKPRVKHDYMLAWYWPSGKIGHQILFQTLTFKIYVCEVTRNEGDCRAESSLRKQLMFHKVAMRALAKRHLSNELRNSILMMCLYPDLGSASEISWNFFNQSEVLARSG